MATKRRKRTTAFGSCMRKKLKGRHFTSKRTARKALGSAARSCAKKRRRRVPATSAMLRRMRSANRWG
jgi:hypothetical protein